MSHQKRCIPTKGISAFLIFISFTVNVAFSKNFYFSSKSGDDHYTSTQAKNKSTPWKSIKKLNEITSLLVAGDSILFKKGEIFYGSIDLIISGTISNPIVITSYGIGVRPIITGFVDINSWKSVGNGVYESAYIAGGTSENMVIINGVPKAVGRFPNKGYLSYESSTEKSITDKQLSSGVNWTGAEIVVRKNHWIIDRNQISSHSGNVVNFKSESTYPGISGFGYFFQNDKRTLDSLGEWFFNFKTKSLLMYFGTEAPETFITKIATIDTLVSLNNSNNVIVDSLSFEGSNKTALQMSGAQHIYIRNCYFSYSGYNAISGSAKNNHSSDINIENCVINYSYNNAIDLDYSFINIFIKDNIIRNTGIFAGMGGNGDGKYLAICCRGSNTLIERNLIDSTGYSGVFFQGSSVTVKNNVVSYSCLVKDDGAGIYSYREVNDPIQYDRHIIGNIVLNSLGASDGTSPKITQAQGIYLDGNTSNVDVLNNTVANCSDYGLFINGSQDVNISQNTLFNNNIQLEMYNWGPGIRNVALEDNIFFSKAKVQLAFEFFTIANDIDKFGTSDKNFFCRPIGDEFLIHTQSTTDSYPGKMYSLSTWNSRYNQDLNSKKTPVIIPEYKIKNLVTGTIVPPDYKTNKNQTSIWPTEHSISLETNAEAEKIIKITLNSHANGKLVLLSLSNIGAISHNKNYILRFKAVSERARIVTVFLGQIEAPYAALSHSQSQIISSTSSASEVLFNAPVSDPNGRIVFQFDTDSGNFSLEDVELYEANVDIANPDHYIRFEYNPTDKIKEVQLDRPYLDAKNKSYQNKLSLLPFSSTVLISLEDLSSKSIQSLVFPKINNTIYTDIPFRLLATSSSGLPAFFKVISGPAALTNGIITLTGSGTVAIEASQPGNEYYNPASAIIDSFIVVKAKQNITFTAISTKTYGDKSFALTASSNSGLAPTFKILSGPATISGSILTFTGIGLVSVESSQSGDNRYEPASTITQSFSVVDTIGTQTKEKQTISFSYISPKTYGDAPFTLDAKNPSGLPITYEINSGPAIVSGSLVTIIGVGLVTITASSGENEKFLSTATTQNFSVNKADQRITIIDLANKSISAVPVPLIAISTTQNPISFSSSNPSAVSISKNLGKWIATILESGTVTITAFQPATDFYNATSQSQTIQIAGNPIDILQLTAFPNPFNERINIGFTTLEAGYITLNIYNLQGNIIKEIFRGNVSAKESKNFVFEPHKLSAGIYIVRLLTPRNSLIRKIILM